MVLWKASIVSHGFTLNWDNITKLPQRCICIRPHMYAGSLQTYVTLCQSAHLPVAFDTKEQAFYCFWKDWPIVKNQWLQWNPSLEEQFPADFFQQLLEYEQVIQPSQLIPLDQIASVMDKDIWNKLELHQQYGVQFMISRQKALMSDDMGCGKTFQCLAVAAYYLRLDPKAYSPILIACPVILQHHWKREIEKWLGPTMHYKYQKDRKKKIKSHQSDIWLVEDTEDFLAHYQESKATFIAMSHHLFAQDKVIKAFQHKNNVEHNPYPFVFVDESHIIKKRDGIIGCNIIQYALKPATIGILVSGTPSSKAHELWTTMYSMLPGLYPQFFDYRIKAHELQKRTMAQKLSFAERYSRIEQIWTWQGQKRGVSYQFNGFENSTELHAILSLFMVRRLKEQVFKDTRGESREVITLPEPTPKQRKELHELLEKAKPKSLPNQPNIKQINRAAFMDAYLATSNIKVAVVKQFMKEYFIPDVLLNNPEEKVLIFFTHAVMRQMLEQVLTEAKINHFSIYGAISMTKRDELQQEFQHNTHNNNYQVALLSIDAAGVGLDFTASNQVFFAEFNFSIDKFEQAKARLVRMNQKRHVFITYLLQPGTTDDIAWSILKYKMRSTSQTLDGESKELKAKRSQKYINQNENQNEIENQDENQNDLIQFEEDEDETQQQQQQQQQQTQTE